ncbi:MAG: sensor histidine kinase [Verrucomicrobiota bacterium]|jgi:signal transduction histidine kinase
MTKDTMNPRLTSEIFSDISSAPPPKSSRGLLVVDDDPSVRHALWFTFRDLYQVQLAESGSQAIDAFEKNRADVAIVDIRMPGMDGMEVLRRLKEIDPQVEVILLTAYETVDYIREALRLGAADYITKPFRVEILRSAVCNAMERRETGRKTSGYNEKLEQLQKEMHSQQIREELARTRNEIYASIIHDLNGPLTVVAGYVELTQHLIQHAEVLNPDQVNTLRNHSSQIARQVKNCIELSRRYLGFLEGKIQASSKTGIKEAFYDVAELLKAHPQARANELVIQPYQEEHYAAVHSTDLLQILLNLTINGLQCTPARHKVELYARYLPERGPRPFLQPAAHTEFMRSPEFQENGPLIAISVHDNGPGIPDSVRSRIFEPYFTTKPPGQGTGLGLSIVKRLVLQSKGAIHLYSMPGEGTVFTVYFAVGK